jgi:CRP-like cAMP-binding protein
MKSFNPDYFIHACNILLLIAYSVRDILWLRIFAVAASLIAMPYFLLQPTTLWAPLGWSAVFVAINGFQCWRLFLERRPIKLTSEEEDVRRLAFSTLPPRKVLQLLSIGSWTTSAPGDRLIEQGKSVESVSLIVKGKVQVASESRVLGDLVPGDIAGSALLMSGAAKAEVDAVAVDMVRAMRWEVGTLERYLGANPDVRIEFQSHLARDLAGKTHRLGKALLNVPAAHDEATGGRSSARNNQHGTDHLK